MVNTHPLIRRHIFLGYRELRIWKGHTLLHLGPTCFGINRITVWGILRNVVIIHAGITGLVFRLTLLWRKFHHQNLILHVFLPLIFCHWLISSLVNILSVSCIGVSYIFHLLCMFLFRKLFKFYNKVFKKFCAKNSFDLSSL